VRNSLNQKTNPLERGPFHGSLGGLLTVLQPVTDAVARVLAVPPVDYERHLSSRPFWVRLEAY